ncbi:hypothetical protein [Sphingomonas sp.]|jgi:hypothetical protein|uniref:hypothetical protein n=1 Tax=Sphingomonas sp. TaxID=28214 RepID=UPI002D8001DE|nr:hypothetical protein [Sphingomonas sp.]HEU0043747.1 hypothetical protein [Sphingomonas sp.]
MTRPGRLWLLVGGWLSALAALLHLGVIIGGPAWYRFFGAGEDMAVGAEQGSWIPPLVTLSIAAILAVWAAYAFAGAGSIRRLPLLRTALVLISGIYLARALILVPIVLLYPHARSAVGPFDFWSSAIVLVYGVAYAAGTWLAWPTLSQRKIA